MTTVKTISCVVVDDEPLALKLMADYVQKRLFAIEGANYQSHESH